MRYLFALLLAGCVTTHRDTAALTARLGDARAGVVSARQSSDALAGHVGASRRISDRVDAKASVILEYMDKQP